MASEAHKCVNLVRNTENNLECSKKSENDFLWSRFTLWSKNCMFFSTEFLYVIIFPKPLPLGSSHAYTFLSNPSFFSSFFCSCPHRASTLSNATMHPRLYFFASRKQPENAPTNWQMTRTHKHFLFFPFHHTLFFVLSSILVHSSRTKIKKKGKKNSTRKSKLNVFRINK